MNASICVLLYGAVLVWLSPAVLRRITHRGLNPRLSVAVWMATVALALVSWTAGAVGLLREVIGPHSAVPLRYCMDMLLAINHFGWYGHLLVGAAGAVAVMVSALVLYRLSKAFQRLWRRSREHARAAHILGSPSPQPGVVVLPAEHAAAYCVAGKPGAIVVTTGALETLSEPELAAVLAHERAHLAGRHPQLMMLLRAMTASMPRLPLFSAAVVAVGRLIEMSADDSAARGHGRDVLLDGLVSLASPRRRHGPALGAADTAVLDRAERLASPVVGAALLCNRAVLAATMAALAIAPAVIAFLCHP